MASPIKTFLQATQTALLALVDGSANRYFNSVAIIPNVSDVVRRMQAHGNRFPCAMIVDELGERHPHNTLLDSRRMSITVGVRNLRDPQGEWATEYLLDLTEIIQAGDGTNPGQRKQFGTGVPIKSLAGPHAGAIGTIGPNEILYLTMMFDYELQRP